MSSVSHEALVTLFQQCPRLGVELLQIATGDQVPASTITQPAPAAFSDLTPAEYRADAVLHLQDASGQLLEVIILEAQLATDGDKRFTWPLYVTGLRVRLRVPATLLVVVLDESVARWCSQPIVLDRAHNVFRPLVLGPTAIPRITSENQARAFPELAVLSVAAHGHEEGAEKLGLAALVGCTALDNDRGRLYADFVHAFLNKAASQALEALMKQDPYTYLSDYANRYLAEGLEKGLEQGLEQGLLQGRRDTLAKLLGLRFGQLPDHVHERIAQADLALLDRWLERVLFASTLDDVLASDS